MRPTLYLVIPCYNEEAALKFTSAVLKEKLQGLIDSKAISQKSRAVFVDDGSKDKTWEVIEKIHDSDPLFLGVKLSRNKGHQNALLAGLMYAAEFSDITISMDADLQDDVNAVDRFIEAYKNDNEIVYGVRSSREKDSIFKRGSAQSFYKIMKRMGVDVVYNHADYRLMSKRAVQALAEFKEVNLFLRGIVPLIGFRTTTVEYERDKRVAGESKYPLRKMLAFAFDGITSFSIKPIHFIFQLGMFFFFATLIFLVYITIQKIIGNTVEGWTFIAGSIWLIGAIQMISIGVIGEYIGKIYSETKSRPRYFVEKTLD